MSTPHYGDPILTADDINLAAYAETMSRFHTETSKPRRERNAVFIDALLDNRYSVVTDDQMESLGTLVQGTHPVDYNPSGVWPFPNPYRD